jgi:D-3-phosphoglycerate dehydrogenase / 2-oxoglutarate reductase
LNAASLGGAMSERPVVVVADPIDGAALAALRAGACTVVDVSGEPARLAEHLGTAWALIVRSRTKVTAELIARAPRLGLVARAGVGLDNVDVAAAEARRIEVVNVPDAATTSVAELTVALYLLLVRELLPSIAATKAGRWERGVRGHELSGRTVGFVGYGRIAREVARRLGPFGARTLAYDPFVPASPDGTRLVPLDVLLAEADIVSVHAALTPENRHVIDAGAFGKMRPGAFLVNVARGALVDEGALVGALRSGRLAGAALDVFETEPPARSELLADPRVVATPHLGASTEEAQRRAGEAVVREVLRALPGAASVAPVSAGSPR